MFEDIYNTVKSSTSSPRDKALLYVIIFCGPKAKELQFLKPEHLSADENSITIHFPNRSIRIEDIGARFAISNWAYSVNKKQFGCYIFSSTRKNGTFTNKPLSAVYMNKILREVFPGKNIRDFRRDFIDQVLKENNCKETIKQQIGLGSDSALLHYTSS
jgi:integrase